MTDLHYEDTGRGAAVVLLHGGGLDLRMWDDQMPWLTARYRVIRFDARGHGDSPTPTEPFRQCDDVAALLAHLGVDRATLIGLSMGAGAATDTALEYPGLVERLVVCGAGTNEPVFDDPWIRDIQQRMADAAARLDAPAWIDLFLQEGVIGPHRTAAGMDPAVLARCREMITTTVTRHVRPDAVTPHHVEGSWDRLAEIGVPALGVIGELDAPDHHTMVERFTKSVPNGRSVTIPGAAHVPNMEQPATFNTALATFLRETGDGLSA